MSKGKTIQEQFTELTPPRLKEIRGCIVRKYLSEKISELENGEYELPISKYDATNLMDSIPVIRKYLLQILLKEIVQKVVPIRKEDTTIRLIVQQDVAENVRQLFQAISQLKDKDINNAISIGERIAKIINKRISK